MQEVCLIIANPTCWKSHWHAGKQVGFYLQNWSFWYEFWWLCGASEPQKACGARQAVTHSAPQHNEKSPSFGMLWV